MIELHRNGIVVILRLSYLPWRLMRWAIPPFLRISSYYTGIFSCSKAAFAQHLLTHFQQKHDSCVPTTARGIASNHGCTAFVYIHFDSRHLRVQGSKLQRRKTHSLLAEMAACAWERVIIF